ncbi:hypothetical protein [Nonomuraea sp. NPDC049784]|uniref:hypothetical protein n=1 Tax=Nonomuraea sp. NPDC049784 TaxID=3154361 RepID=UPI0033D27BA8
MARLEFAEGAFSRLRVPVRAEDAEPGRDILTDLDILAIDVDPRLRVSRSTLECKGEKGEAKEADRLFCLAGLRQYLAIQRAVLVRPTVSRRGRALARRLDIGIMDISTLQHRESAHEWLPETFAHLGGEACLAAEARTDSQLKGLPELSSDVITFLRHDALLASPYAILGALGNLGRAIERRGVLPEPTGQVIAGHALIALLLAALQDAAQLDLVPADVLRRRTERALTAGNPDDDHILDVLNRADDLVQFMMDRVHRAYIEAGAARQEIHPIKLREIIETPPGFLSSYIDLVERFRTNPEVSRHILRTAELTCFDALLDGDAWTQPAFDHLFTAEHQGLLLAAIATLGQVATKQIAQRLSPIANISFDRSAGAAPDRHTRAHKGGTQSNLF